MLDQIPYIVVPFLISFFQVLTSAFALGFIPALWLFRTRRHFNLLWRWSVVMLVCIAAAAYGLPAAQEAWKAHTGVAFKKIPLWMGYFISVLFAPMVIPEPLRLARKRIRNERPAAQTRRGFRLPK